eukprot:CAMPEP_0175051894 /NCGR_PEP_ID=MMETSP0052_2-20121109/8058_1 /TAXON_ID=51329 ORGANISM="Polytomella parva, Strain SAG 63-3" /NCGR_SAMPLE_ID=MMETSP0052_2 /ASSEMBLY_ACC=CAM_ASM_000194 /LENGTH=240 /DNA_ID=CAMNT_0016316239 /DNA_START=87 /DNA_END=809 /DNA_ORIENTATION=-
MLALMGARLQAKTFSNFASICTSSRLSMPNIEIPPLGESIKEGSICAVFKQAGAQVTVDETIAQIETDKVTIDIKSPVTGTLTSFTVKVSDVVIPGQIIAAVESGSSAAPAATPAPPSVATPVTSDAPAMAVHARKPMISFPPRVTASGERISSLPRAVAEAYLASLKGSPAPVTPATTPVASAAPSTKPAACAAIPKNSPELSTPKVRATTGKGKGRTTGLMTPFTQKELDVVNLGGAY